MELFFEYLPIILGVIVVIGLIINNKSSGKRKSSGGNGSTENSNLSVRPLSKNGEYIYKPISDGKGYGGGLALILPKQWRCRKVVVHKTTCYDGKVSKELKNRQVFRTKQSGSAFPNNTIITHYMVDGSIVKKRVPNSSVRYGRKI